MSKKLLTLVIVLGLVSSASAVNVWWYGMVDSDWNNGDNYSNSAVPTTDTGINFGLSGWDTVDVPDRHVLTLNAGETGNCKDIWSYAESGLGSETERTATLQINDGHLNSSGNMTAGVTGPDRHTVINILDGIVDVPVYTIIGQTIGTLGDTDGCLLHMEGGTLNTFMLWTGRNTYGKVELYGGTINISRAEWKGLYTGNPGVYETEWATIDITEGEIIWDGDHTDIGSGRVTELIDADVLMAYGGSGTVNCEYDFLNDKTRVWGVPEPATIGLLGLSGLLLLRRRKT
jgi:hypothetical protein